MTVPHHIQNYPTGLKIVYFTTIIEHIQYTTVYISPIITATNDHKAALFCFYSEEQTIQSFHLGQGC